MSHNFYETDRAVSEYLLFHYGLNAQMLPAGLLAPEALDFPVRCVTDCLDLQRLPARPRALDLGCAVGRATFELARHCPQVLGMDYSEHFVTVAGHLRKNGSFLFGCVKEGELTEPCQAVVPPEIDRNRVSFERGNALDLRADLGGFDVVLMANLLDRLSHPRRCLEQMAGLLGAGGQLIITSPYTWLTEYTPRDHWLGGFEHEGSPIRTIDALKEILLPDFKLSTRKELPFLIREHARKFQLGIAEATVWIRN
jgi:putative 4-mercaptohistidine N1-methyltranferase